MSHWFRYVLIIPPNCAQLCALCACKCTWGLGVTVTSASPEHKCSGAGGSSNMPVATRNAMAMAQREGKAAGEEGALYKDTIAITTQGKRETCPK